MPRLLLAHTTNFLKPPRVSNDSPNRTVLDISFCREDMLENYKLDDGIFLCQFGLCKAKGKAISYVQLRLVGRQRA
ncbi:hypothetical protein V6N12_029748 [Hibiscus sabdariffa]|uniref:Uncharacterized protein n=1 Tax=Hibiscus sabdariffa TaxID=183260 RepID=A0ABR2CXD1_9ROSI